jgi:1-acyl-sn-glycerol-3-phosphate acyltransferase
MSEHVRTLIFYLVVMPYSFFLISVCLIIGLFPGGTTAMHWIDRVMWARGWIRLTGVTVKTTGAIELLDPSVPYVFTSNHQSNFDIPATKVALRNRILLFVTKRSLLYVPLGGWYLWRAGYPLIDRSNKEKARKTLNRAAEQVRNGTSVLVFPEGTRTSSGEIEDFKRGAFVLAIKAQVPVVPLTISGSMAIMSRHSFGVRRGEIHIHVGSPISTASLSLEDRHLLSDQVKRAISEQYKIQRTSKDTFQM